MLLPVDLGGNMTDYFANSGLFAWLMENLRAIAGMRSPFMNTAMSGFFSSDRTINEYNDKIWHLKAIK